VPDVELPAADAQPTAASTVSSESKHTESDVGEEAAEHASRNELKFISSDDDFAARSPDIAPLDLAPLVDLPEPVAEPVAARESELVAEQVASPEPVFAAETVAPADEEEPEAEAASTRNGSSAHSEEESPLYGLDVISTTEFSLEELKAQTVHLTPDEDFVDLGEWLERNRTPVSTRMVTHDEEPLNDEQKDFGEMLDKFKAGISKNVDEEDFGSHYDLGIAFREMGLLDEAIGSFQKAARGKEQHVRACEAIGECFMDKGEAGVTISVLQKLILEPGINDQRLVGVLYLLGRAAESLGRSADAAGYFQRVLAVHIGFRDAAERLSSLTQTAR